jgi:L-rhamnose mutarotase
MVSRKLCYTCDLKNDPQLIAEYKKYHQAVWPEIKNSILDSGIINMEIYNLANRLFMIMEVDESYTPERKQMMDLANSKVQKWEKLMWKFQQAPLGGKEGEKWIEMEQIFRLNQD